jgi:GH24 family phage-related lysozyme (muramidase)
MQGEVLSNVIGAPFSQFVIDQLNLRASVGSTANRTNEEILYLANRMSWTRLTSSVRIKPALNQPLSKFYSNLFNGQIPPGDYSEASSLAKNWILQAGTAQYVNGTYGLRYGFGANGAYGLGGIQEQGYRPMPGLNSVTIDTKGTLGSLREADIKFSVWNMTQLNVIESLYFRLGYTMLLEWGNVNYFNNKRQFITQPFGLDIFSYNSKEQIFQEITQRNQQSDGNYEAMLGTVTNFYYAFNEQGGFDCNIKLLGLGSIIDTLKINQTFVMPSSLAAKVQEAAQNLEAQKEKEAKDAATAASIKARTDGGLVATLPPPVTNLETLKAAYKTFRSGKFELVDAGVTFTGLAYYKDRKFFLEDYYLKATQESAASNNEFNKERFGLFLVGSVRRGKTLQRIPADLSQPQVKLDFENLNAVAVTQGYKESLKQFDTVTLAPTPGVLYPKKGLWEPTKGIATTVVGQIIDSGLSAYNTGFFSFNTAPFSGTLFETAEVKNTFAVIIAYVLRDQQKFIRFEFSPASGLKRTRKEYVQAINNWLINDRTITLTQIAVRNLAGNDQIFYSGNIVGLKVGNESFSGFINSNDTGLIQTALPNPAPGSPTPATGATVNPQGNTEGGENQTTPGQVMQEAKFNSALHTMLTSVGTLVRGAAVGSSQQIIPFDLTETTNIFYQYGILKNVLDNTTTLTTGTGGVDFELTKYAKKGFNSNLMADKKKFASVKDVDWKSLCQAYYVGYNFSANGSVTPNSSEKPVYIKLGYLLAFLNNMCLLYEASSKADGAKGNNKNTVKPYVYIDFHPEYNFCLTSPQHLTVDPYKCFIPLAASDEEYLQIYDESIRDKIKSVAFKSKTENYVSAPLSSFKTENAYRGKTMEILLNTQYLLDLANQFVSNDKQATVALKPFLDALIQDINKSTGNFNVFRVQYRDDSNTIIIKDDQWTPALPQETSTIIRETYLDNRRFMELQIFGSGSLVREMDFKTNMNTKMSSMIAISAQAGQQYANGVDATPLGTYNENFQDAFMPVKQNADSGSFGDTFAKLGATSLEDAGTIIQKQLSQGRTEAEIKALIGESAYGTITQKQQIENNNKDSAEKFNDYIMSVYKNGTVPTEQTKLAANYYIDRMSVVKGSNEITKGGPFIPANLGITIDGISGIVMGNAFCIPENRLPASLRGFDGNTKVGFVVVGLTHALENNQWLTKIRGQMIKLRQKVNVATTVVTSTVNNFSTVASSGGVSMGGGEVGTITFQGDAFESAVKFIKEQEQLASIRKLDTSSKNRRIYYAPKNASPTLTIYPYNLEGNKRKDGSFKLTIGWGTYDFYRAGPKANQPILPNDTITAQLAEENLRVELAALYKDIQAASKKFNVTPTTGQVVALLDLGYNAGAGGMKDSPLWKAFTGKGTATKASFTQYRVGTDFAGPLAKRRALEYNAFIS